MWEDAAIGVLRVLSVGMLLATLWAVSAPGAERVTRRADPVLLGTALMLLVSVLDSTSDLDPWASGLRTAGVSGLAGSPALLFGYVAGLLLLAAGFLRAGRAIGGLRAPAGRGGRSAAQALRESEARYRTLVEHAPEAILVLDIDANQFADANENACRVFKLEREDLLQRGPGELSPPRQPNGESSMTAGQRFRDEALAGGAPVFEWIHRDAEGNDIPCEVRLVRLPSSERRLIRGSITDITERKRSELLLTGKGQILELIADNAPLWQVLDAIVDIVQRSCPEALCSILLLDETGKHLQLVSAPDLPSDYNEAVDGLAIGPAAGCCGTAAYERRPVVSTDIARDPLWKSYAGEALRHGLRACWSTPIFSADTQVLGTYAVYYRAPRGPADWEIDIVAKVTHLAGIAIERKRAQESLRETEANFRRLFDNVAAAVFQTTVDGQVISANPALVRLLGYEFTEDLRSLEDPARVYGHGRDWTQVTQQLAARGELKNEEFTLTRADGDDVVVLVSAHTVRDEDDAVLFYEGTLTDVTQLKRAERELRENRNFYELILDSVPILIAYVKSDGRVEFTNASYAAWFETSRGELVGKHVREIMPGAVLEAGLSGIDRVLRGESVSFQATVDRGEEMRELHVAFLPHESPTREVLGFFAVLQDMTDYWQLEAQLRQAQKMEAVGQLTGGVAHDFNNLLNVVLGNLQLVELTLPEKGSGREKIQMAVKAALRGAELTKRLLAFSRQQVLEPKTVSLNQLVSGMDDLLRRTIGEAVEVKLVFSGDLWPVSVDPGQLENALLNLAINARDAMPGGGSLVIETKNVVLEKDYARRHGEVEAGEFVALEVTDTGTGMSGAVLDQVFQPFFTTKGAGRGSGLGLSMVYGFVKQSGGHAKIYSELDYGTSVKLYFPRAESSAGEDEAATVTDAVPRGDGQKLLVVEDDPLVRRTAIAVLEDFGYRVVSAATGSDALAILKQQSDIELLFTDLIMPGGMDGATLAREALEMQPDIKVLFTTGYAKQTVIQKGILDRGSELIGKPYRREQLARKIHTVLGA